MFEKQRGSYDIEFLHKPGHTLTDEEVLRLNGELRRVASTCFDEIPEYQCLQQGRERSALRDKVITLARRKEDGVLMGFCSAVLLPVDGVGEVLHLGLTCVHPGARGHHLTHQLTSKLLLNYLLRHRPFGKLWISNVACVLSSLGNVAMNFEDVFPSPYGKSTPGETHMKIAQAVDAHFRAHMAIKEDAVFCPKTFIFQGSVSDTIFEKHADDTQYHHRKPFLNQFYLELMRFDRGDEVFQVGHVSLLSLARYFLRKGTRQPTTAAAEILTSTAH